MPIEIVPQYLKYGPYGEAESEAASDLFRACQSKYIQIQIGHDERKNYI